jgi:hypothetical protein
VRLRAPRFPKKRGIIMEYAEQCEKLIEELKKKIEKQIQVLFQ